MKLDRDKHYIDCDWFSRLEPQWPKRKDFTLVPEFEAWLNEYTTADRIIFKFEAHGFAAWEQWYEIHIKDPEIHMLMKLTWA